MESMVKSGSRIKNWVGSKAVATPATTDGKRIRVDNPKWIRTPPSMNHDVTEMKKRLRHRCTERVILLLLRMGFQMMSFTR